MPTIHFNSNAGYLFYPYDLLASDWVYFLPIKFQGNDTQFSQLSC